MRADANRIGFFVKQKPQALNRLKPRNQSVVTECDIFMF